MATRWSRATSLIRIRVTSRHGYLFLSDRVVDRLGKVVTNELPGTVIALSSKYVILYDERTSEYAAYRRTS